MFQSKANKNPSPEMIAGWIKKYGELNVLELGGKTAYVRDPTDKENAAAARSSLDNNCQFDEYKYMQKCFQAGFLGGDYDLINQKDELLKLLKENGKHS